MNENQDIQHPRPRLSELRRLCQIARKLSTLEAPSDWTTTRTHYAEQLFEKTVLISLSFLKLLPKTYDKDAEAFDFSSLATLARNVMECCNVFHYLCIDRIPKTEFKFRLNLMWLHQSVNSERILKAFQLGKASHSDDLARMLPKFDLKRNPFFNSLDESVRNQLLKGKKPYYWKLNKSHSNFVLRDLESALYNYFSNSVHSFPLGIYYSSEYREGYHLNLYSLYFLSVETMIIYLASTIRSYLKLRRKHSRYITIDENTFITDCISDRFIQDWIKYRSWYTGKHL